MPSTESLCADILAAWSERPMPKWQRVSHGMASLDAVAMSAVKLPGLAVGRIARPDGREVIGVRLSGGHARKRAARDTVRRVVPSGADLDIREIPTPRILSMAMVPAGQAVAPHFAGHCRPLRMGCSISNENGGAGTLSGFMRDTAGITYALSCCHVIARGGKAVEGENVCQPAQQDQSVVLAGNRIGHLTSKFAPLVPRRDGNLDAALAALLPGCAQGVVNALPGAALTGANQVPAGIHGRTLAPRTAVTTLPRGKTLAKLGRTTGYTEGVLHLDRLVNFTPYIELNGAWDTYYFSDVIEVESVDQARPFARGGDSGALVFTVPELQPIGIHFCSVPIDGAPSLNYLMPLARICDTFAVELV